MRNFLKSSFYLFAVLFSCSSMAQSINGVVKDHADNRVLPFVSISIEGTTKGTISDIDGYFSLTPNKYPVELRFHTLGYRDTVIAFNQGGQVKVSMSELATQLREAVLVAGENPAIPIIKKAIKNRDVNNPEKSTSFRYETYSKMVFGPDVSQFDDELVLTDSSSSEDSARYEFKSAMQNHYLFITETVSQRIFSPPSRSYEKVIANRFSGFSNPTFTMIATEFQPFTYNTDYVDVIGLKYLSPLARNSYKDYVFVLKETLFEGSDSLFVLYFQPRKGKTFHGLKGTMTIHSNGYAIQNIQVEQANPTSNMKIEIEQMSDLIYGKQWFPIQFNTHLKFIMDEEESSNLGVAFINARGKTYIRNIQLEEDIDRKEFSNVNLELDSEANEKSEDYWKEHRKGELNSKELSTYQVIDSIGEKHNFDKKLLVAEALGSGLIPIGPVSIELNKVIDYNEWEGLRLGLGVRTNEKVSKYFTIGGYGAYGFNDKASKFGGDLKLNIAPKNDVFMGVKYKYDVSPTGMVSFHKKESFNLRSYSDLYISKMDLIEGFEAYLTFRSFKDVQNRLFYSQYNQSYTYDYTYAPAGDTVLTKNNNFNKVEIGWSFRFGYKERYIRNFNRNISLGSKYPYVWVRIAAADTAIGSTFSYQKVDVKIAKNYQIKGFGKLGFQLTGGTITGDVPITMLSYGAGMRVTGFNLYIENAFNTMAPNEFVSETYASAFVHYNVGAIYKKKFSAPEISLVTGVGWGTLSNPEYHQGMEFLTMEKGYYESGLLLDNILVSGTSGFGMGAFYRYGPYALPNLADNFGFNFTVMYVFQ